MSLKVGSRLRTATSTAEVIVVKSSATDGALTCAGGPMTTDDVTAGEQAGNDSPVLLGKRYTDPESGLELLATKPGPGPLVFDGRELSVKSASALPASD